MGAALNACPNATPLPRHSLPYDENPMSQITHSGMIVAYLRVSTDKQDVQAQRYVVSRDIESKYPNVNLEEDVTWIIDEATSATKSKGLRHRSGGQKLLDLITSGKVGSVFTFKVDRLFRNLKEGSIHREDYMKKYPHHFFSQDFQDIDINSIGGFVQFTMHLMMAEVESMNTSTRTCGGMDNARSELTSTGRLPFGWDKEWNGKTRQKKQQTIKVYDMVPNWYEQDVKDWAKKENEKHGMSWGEIARKLNAAGIKGKNGGNWTRTSISRSIHNCKYDLELHRFDRPKSTFKL